MPAAKVIRAFLVGSFILLLLPFPGLLTHSSLNPAVLGQYSSGYFVLLLVYSVALFASGSAALLAFRVGESRLERVGSWLSGLRNRRILYFSFLTSPWILLAVIVDAMQAYEPGRSPVFQISLLLLVLFFDLSLLTFGRPPAEAGVAAASALLALLSLSISLSAVELILRRLPTLIPDTARPHLAGGGIFLRQDLVFDKPMQVGFRYRPNQDRNFDYHISDGDLYRWEAGSLPPLSPEQNSILAQVHFVTDENGYPNQPPTLDRYDVVVTGDSFTAAENVANPWPSLLEQSGGFRVLNLGMPLYTTGGEEAAVRLYGLSKHPDWVILAYFEGNDMIIEAPSFDAKLRSGLSWVEDDLIEGGPYASSVAIQSIRYGFPELLERAWGTLLIHPADSPKSPRSYRFPIVVQTTRGRTSVAFFDDYLSGLTASLQDINLSHNFRLVADALVALDKEARASGAKLLILYIPSKEHVFAPLITEAESWKMVLEGVHLVRITPSGFLSSEQTPLATPQMLRDRADDQRKAIADLSRSKGIRLLDLTNDLQAAASEGADLYYLADTHWNQNGHKLVARLVADYLAKK